MNTRKLLWVIVVLIGGILLGMALDDFIYGEFGTNSLLNLGPSLLLTIFGTWQLIKE